MTRTGDNLSLAVLTHAAVAAELGLAGCPVALFSVLPSLDPSVVATLSLALSSLMAIGSGISAFILLSVERAEAR